VLLSSVLLSQAGFAHGFTERDATLADLLAWLGTPAIVQARQVHGARAVMAGDAEGQEADAIVACRPDGAGLPLAVGVRVADCAAVLLADAATGAVAAIHAGWRGVVAGVVRSAAARLRGKDRVAAIGPCIGPCCFEVGLDVAARIAGASEGARVIDREVGGKAYVDLRRAVRAQLRAVGVDDERIEDVAGCTKHEAERFHSFRRDGANSGRLLAAIATRR
jgi:YfiH family protein